MQYRRYLFVLPIIAIIAVSVMRSRSIEYVTTTVVRAPIEEEVLATGHLESPSAIDLHFKTAGKLASLRVRTGDAVIKGQILASQDKGVLDAQIAQASAAVSQAKANLAKIEAGATPEAIALSRAGVTVASRNLDNKYQGVPAALSDAYAKAIDAIQNQLAALFANPSTANPQLTFFVSDSHIASTIGPSLVDLYADLSDWKIELSSLSPESTREELDAALLRADLHLKKTSDFLTLAVAAVAANTGLSASTAATYRTSVALGQTEVYGAITSMKTIEQGISSAKASLEQANAALVLTEHATTESDREAARAMLKEAEANLRAISAGGRDLELIAPWDGIVTDTNGKPGEVVTPAMLVVSLMPRSKLDVNANVAEGGIVRVKEGQRVVMDLDAFPGRQFEGVVGRIDPAETVIGGGVYYQTRIMFLFDDPGLRPGMTANVRIETGSSTDALVVPASALVFTSTSTIARVMSGTLSAPRIVVTGMRSQDGMVEILSGLSEGERVILGER